MTESFLAIIWPPAFHLKKGMEQEINKHYKVDGSESYVLTKECFKKFMFKTYKPDKTPPKRVNKKYRAMRRDSLNVQIISISVPNPTMMPHKKTRLKGTFYCQEMKRLKRIIRERFSPEVKGYIYDVIIHISDNQKHNERTRKLIKRYGNKIN